MINIYGLFNFFRKQWLGTIMICVFILYLLFSTFDNAKISYNNKIIHDTIIKREHAIDTLYKDRKIIVNKIKLIKEKDGVEVKNVDTMRISSLSLFFSKRYPESDIKGTNCEGSN